MTDGLLTLDQAAELIPGADSATLLRRIRQGKLSATRPGKSYLTTRADIAAMVEACRVIPKVRAYGSVPRAPASPPLGSCSTDLASAALDSALAQATLKKKRL